MEVVVNKILFINWNIIEQLGEIYLQMNADVVELRKPEGPSGASSSEGDPPLQSQQQS